MAGSRSQASWKAECEPGAASHDPTDPNLNPRSVFGDADWRFSWTASGSEPFYPRLSPQVGDEFRPDRACCQGELKVKRPIAVSLVMVSTLSLAGCIGEAVQVPPAYVGKILSKDGFQPGLISPSQFRLPICFFYCDRLIVAESSDFQKREAFRDDHALYMPRSELAMPFDVRGTFAVRNDDKALQSVFDRIPASRPRGLLRGKVHGVISQEKLYETYCVAVVRDVVRRIVAR